MTDRHSITDLPHVEMDENKKAEAEARNALRQFEFALIFLKHIIEKGGDGFILRPSDVLSFNRLALEGVHDYSGLYRNVPVSIGGSRHQPPPHDQVPRLVEDFCEYINQNWKLKSPIHLAAYALWRINWIHPFADGNGRTARILSYIILSGGIGYRLPGVVTIPERIAYDKKPYYHALEASDDAFSIGRIELSRMEELLEYYLTQQLEEAILDKTVYSEISPTQFVTKEEILEPQKVITPQFTLNLNFPRGQRKNIIERNPTTFNFIYTVLGAIIGLLLPHIVAYLSTK